MEYYLGIDLGTSSVKAILLKDGVVYKKEKVTYSEVSISGWESAVKSVISNILSDIDKSKLSALAFSSQVGTYITDGTEIINWFESVGGEELAQIKSTFSDEEIFAEISMYHPDIISYPLPRYLYIKRKYPDTRSVIMPKEHFIKRLTGRLVSDPYSYRGLYNFREGRLATKLLEKLGIDFSLPEILDPTALAGVVTGAAAAEFSLPAGLPVYIGMNDFFSGLVGMGVMNVGDAFELSGTSEHIGYISDNIAAPPSVSGNYLVGFATYGGTKSSGISCDFALNNFEAEKIENIDYVNSAPIFLPYLKGERAPIYDENARGVFFGIDGECDLAKLGYSVFEGVVFSLYDIARLIDMPSGGRLITGGGSTKNLLMAKIKAEIFDKDIVVCREPDSSALGAAFCAMVGVGACESLTDAAKFVEYETIDTPSGEYKKILTERFSLYHSLYSALKPEFLKLKALKEIQK